MAKTLRPLSRGIVTSIAVLATLSVTSLSTLGFMLLPDLPLLGVVVDQSTQSPDRTALDALATQFRVTLEEQYFNWSIVSIALGGATLWRQPPSGLSLYVRAVLAIGFILVSLSILLGVGYMDYMAEGLALGFTMLRSSSSVSVYPAIQFFCLANGFVLLGFAALLTTFRQGAPAREGAA